MLPRDQSIPIAPFTLVAAFKGGPFTPLSSTLTQRVEIVIKQRLFRGPLAYKVDEIFLTAV